MNKVYCHQVSNIALDTIFNKNCFPGGNLRTFCVLRKEKHEETLPYDSPQNIDLILKRYIHVIYLYFGRKDAGGPSEWTCLPLI